jgi:hypothetical protein
MLGNVGRTGLDQYRETYFTTIGDKATIHWLNQQHVIQEQ